MPANQTSETDVASSESSPITAARSSVVWGTTAFVPGGDVGLVARRTVALVERDNPSTRERLWGLVADDAPLDDILDELSSTGLKALPDFGLAQVEGSAIRIVARGRTTISVRLGSGSTREIDSSGVRTWIEELVDDVAAVTIALPALDGDAAEPSGETFAVLAGSVPAASLTRRFDAEDDHAEIAESGAGWTAVETESPKGSTQAPAPVSEVEEELAPAQESGETDGEVNESEVATADRADRAETEAVPVAGAAGAAPSGAQPASPQPPPPGARLAGPPPGGPASSIFDDDFDDHAAGSVTGSQPGDHDAVPSGRSEPEAPQTDAAKALGVLAFSNGERIEVDRSILIGRNPKVSGAVEGAMPHIMRFDGPGQGLSRTHAEVRIEDGEVVIEDLQSTNGTEVQLPGQQRRRLRGGEPVVIVAGTLIDFGDELNCTVESPS